MLGNLKSAEVDVDYWIDALNHGNVTIATDGSVAAQRGYFAMVLHTDQQQLCFQGPCGSARSMMSSYRTELTNILSALYLLHALSDYSGIHITTRQLLYCDNAAAVSRANKIIDPGIMACMTADYNLVKEIEVVKSKGLDLHMEWVKAHQDKKTLVDLLSLKAQLNVKADADVTEFRMNPPPHLTPTASPLQFWSTKASITINNTVITSNLQQWIRDNYLGSNISQYIQRKT
eukprot:9128541-Ditylum_brightwellii.AAC.1